MDAQTCLKKLQYVGVLNFATVGLDGTPQAVSYTHLRKIARGIRCIIIPGTQNIYLEAMRAGYVETFIQAGCVVSTPTCCLLYTSSRRAGAGIFGSFSDIREKMRTGISDYR